MTWLDRRIQAWRLRVARPWLPSPGRLLDVGCHQGETFDALGSHVAPGSLGVDPLTTSRHTERYALRRNTFPGEPVPDNTFDAVVMLATLEHIADKPALAVACAKALKPGGRVVITVPSPRVDAILAMLVRFRLVDGMSLEEHHDFDPRTTPAVFEAAGFRVIAHQSFQLGLNNLYVFEKR